MSTLCARLGLALMLLATTVHADDRTLSFLHGCRLHDVQSATDHGAVVLRMWPLNAIPKSLPARTAALSTIIDDIDTVSLIGTYSLVQKIDEPGTLLFASEKVPDTFMFIRGREVTVFPRVMMISPRVALTAVQRNDVVASLLFTSLHAGKNPKYLQSLQKEDPFRGLLFEDASFKEAKISEIRLAGPLLTPTQSGVKPVKINGTTPVKVTPAIFFDQLKDGKEAEVDIKKRLGNLANQTPVYVVRRVTSNFDLRYVIPLRNTGFFGVNGSFVKGVAASRGDQSASALNIVWDQFFGSHLGSITLQKGDVLEYTLLDLVPPFNNVSIGK